MKLRPLESRDAAGMLEWMHNSSVTGYLGTNFAEKTLQDCLRFIENSVGNTENLHLAIADEFDEYMGTVSLKHIDPPASTAEFAITVRHCAMGKGYSAYGMQAILDLGKARGIDRIYWCVSRENLRAVRFYDKNGYARTDTVPQSLLNYYTPTQLESFIWYLY